MNALVLADYGESLRVRDSKIVLLRYARGRTGASEQESWALEEFPYQSVVIRNITGSLSLEAIHSLALLKVPVLFLRFNGLLESILLPAYNNTAGRIKIEQMRIAMNPELSGQINDAIQGIHIRNMQSVEEQLGFAVRKITTRPSIAEGEQSVFYWQCLEDFIHKSLLQFNFVGRRPVGYRYNFSAMSEINSLRNYVGALQESLVRKYIQETGLLPEVGFSHSEQSGKEPLVWDAIETMRTHMDVLTLNLLLTEQVKKSDFRRLDNLEVYLKADACKKVVKLVGDWWGQDSGIRLRRNTCSWESVLAENIRQLVPLMNRGTKVGQLGEFQVPAPQVAVV